MNLLLIKPEEIKDNSAIISDRAGYVNYYHDLKPGITIKCGVLNGKIGKAEIKEVNQESIKLDFVLDQEPLQQLPISLFCSVCRPQTVKKLIQIAAIFGVKRLYFFKSELTEKSYLQSKALLEENIEKEVINGLEQGVNTFLPDIKVFKNFYELTKKVDLNNEINFLSEIESNSNLINFKENINKFEPINFLLGPESGFTDKEINTFKSYKFNNIKISDRMLRIEHAATSLISQYELIKSSIK